MKLIDINIVYHFLLIDAVYAIIASLQIIKKKKLKIPLFT